MIYVQSINLKKVEGGFFFSSLRRTVLNFDFSINERGGGGGHGFVFVMPECIQAHIKTYVYVIYLYCGLKNPRGRESMT